MGEVVELRRRLFVFGRIERVVTRDKIVEDADGGWSTVRRRPPGLGWEIEKDGERSTVWRRCVP